MCDNGHKATAIHCQLPQPLICEPYTSVCLQKLSENGYAVSQIKALVFIGFTDLNRLVQAHLLFWTIGVKTGNDPYPERPPTSCVSSVFSKP
jgi:hypothetical protein